MYHTSKSKGSKTIDQIVEKAALWVAQDIEERPGEISIASTLEEEIALTLEQLAQVRALHNNIEHQLLLLECAIDTDLLQLEPRPHHYGDQHQGEINTLKGRILTIAFERQKLSKEKQEKEQHFHDRLLSLLNKLRLVRE